MHDLLNPVNQVDPHVVESKELVGKTCASCQRVLAYEFFEKDSSKLDGRRIQCIDCEAQPRLSTSEHVSRLNEMNFNSDAVKKQRWGHQLDYMNSDARVGNKMHSSEFILKLRNVLGLDKLFLTDGRFLGDIAAYQISGVRRSDFDGPRGDFKYLFYLPTGWLPEYSIYEFDSRAAPVREHRRGWRTPLLRFIKKGLITEDQTNWEFGTAEGIASTVYKRELYQHRNKITV